MFIFLALFCIFIFGMMQRQETFFCSHVSVMFWFLFHFDFTFTDIFCQSFCLCYVLSCNQKQKVFLVPFKVCRCVMFVNSVMVASNVM